MHFLEWKFMNFNIKNSLNFVPKGSINNIPALVQIMTSCQTGDKPLSEPMMLSLLTHICLTRPQWVKLAEYGFASLIIISLTFMAFIYNTNVYKAVQHKHTAADICPQHAMKKSFNHVLWNSWHRPNEISENRHQRCLWLQSIQSRPIMILMV